MSCFAEKTMIATEHGEVAIGDLRPGDKVLTRDNGLQSVRWVGLKPLSGRFLLDHPHLRPVLVACGALGAGLPARDTMMSPNCRIPMATTGGRFLNRTLEERQAIKTMINHRDVQQIDTIGITYVHLILGGHEVISANGVWVENFKSSDLSLNPLGNAQRLEIFEVFPEIKERCTREADRRRNETSARPKAGLLRRFM